MPSIERGFANKYFFSTVPTKSAKSIKTSILTVLGVAGIGTSAFLVYNSRDACSPVHKYLTLPLLHMLDPETAHTLSIKFLSTFPWLCPRQYGADDPILKTTLFGKEFPNPVGVAAGFDKSAQAISALHNLGFGFVEIGTVTPLPQQGNPKPRVFRLKEDKAVINRYGFNNDGIDAVKERIENWKLGHGEKILGINIGKNKNTIQASEDYTKGIINFSQYADYLVINISSPNTPGLRTLQGAAELDKLLVKVLEARTKCQNKPPILIKIAPDLTYEEMKDIAKVSLKRGVDGLIISNTTVSRPNSLRSVHKKEDGGLSGRPLFERSNEVLEDMYKLTGGRIPLIGVGGISSGKDAYVKIRKGASLVQLYTAFSYEGPCLVPTIKIELAELLKRDGFGSITEAVGVDCRVKYCASIGQITKLISRTPQY